MSGPSAEAVAVKLGPFAYCGYADCFKESPHGPCRTHADIARALDAFAEAQRAALRSEVERLSGIVKLQAAALEVWKAGKATKPA